MLEATSTIVTLRRTTTIAVSRKKTDVRGTRYIPSNARASQVSAFTNIVGQRDDGTVISACRIVDGKRVRRSLPGRGDTPRRGSDVGYGHQRLTPSVTVVAPILVAVPTVVVILVAPAVLPVAADVPAARVVRRHPVSTGERRPSPVTVVPCPSSPHRIPVPFNPLV